MGCGHGDTAGASESRRRRSTSTCAPGVGVALRGSSRRLPHVPGEPAGRVGPSVCACSGDSTMASLVSSDPTTGCLGRNLGYQCEVLPHREGREREPREGRDVLRAWRRSRVSHSRACMHFGVGAVMSCEWERARQWGLGRIRGGQTDGRWPTELGRSAVELAASSTWCPLCGKRAAFPGVQCTVQSPGDHV